MFRIPMKNGPSFTNNNTENSQHLQGTFCSFQSLASYFTLSPSTTTTLRILQHFQGTFSSFQTPCLLLHTLSFNNNNTENLAALPRDLLFLSDPWPLTSHSLLQQTKTLRISQHFQGTFCSFLSLAC